MSKLELFAEVDMKGESVSVSADTPDLTSVGFLRHAKSLRVYGEDPWIVFSDTNYQGEFRAYKEGEYNSIPGFEKMISSVRVERGGLYDPEITVYEHVNYGGKSLTLKKSAKDLSTYGMNDMISSHIVHRGAWLLYQKKNYQGKRMVSVAGDQVPNYVPLGWNDKVSSIKFISHVVTMASE